MFSHLSEDRWASFLNLLFSHLAIGGIAVLTVCGKTIANRLRAGDPFYGLDATDTGEILRGFDDAGFGFARQSSGIATDWGLSLTSPRRVLLFLDAFHDLKVLTFAEGGWADHLDVVSVVKT